MEGEWRLMMENGTWGKWEAVNPRMLLGAEYRTTERHVRIHSRIFRTRFSLL
jgi:hypothetical protein